MLMLANKHVCRWSYKDYNHKMREVLTCQPTGGHQNISTIFMGLKSPTLALIRDELSSDAL